MAPLRLRFAYFKIDKAQRHQYSTFDVGRSMFDVRVYSLSNPGSAIEAPKLIEKVSQTRVQRFKALGSKVNGLGLSHTNNNVAFRHLLGH